MDGLTGDLIGACPDGFDRQHTEHPAGDPIDHLQGRPRGAG